MLEDNSIIKAVIIMAAGEELEKSSSYKVGGAPLLEHVIALASTLVTENIFLVTSKNILVSKAKQVNAVDHWDSVLEALKAIPKQNVLVISGDTLVMRFDLIQGMCNIFNGSATDGSPVAAVVLNWDTQQEQSMEIRSLSIAEMQRPYLWNAMAMLCHSQICANVINGFKDTAENVRFDLNTLAFETLARGPAMCCMSVGRGYAARARSNTELALLEHYYQLEMREKFLNEGVIMVAPETVFFGFNNQISEGVTIHPYVTFGPGVVIENGAEIHSFSVIEKATIKSFASIGPFARLSGGTSVGSHSVVGNFTEVKRSKIGRNVKMKHMGYLGDTSVGDRTNIGAGVVICNYDGSKKHKTTIGAECFLGANSSLIAPLTVGKGSGVGAGSVINQEVKAGELAVSRAKQKNINNGWAERKAKKKSSTKPKKSG